MAGNKTISPCCGAPSANWKEVRERLDDCGKVGGIVVPWISGGFAETNDESPSRGRDGGNSVNSALYVVRPTKSRDGIQP
jgi:hypothetical protein